jgi:hypothetical protein
VPSAADPTCGSTSSTAVDDAILYCNKSSISAPYKSNELTEQACTYTLIYSILCSL